MSCRDTIVANTTLHADLVNCSGTGLVIAADGITLDLNGHTITGNLNGDHTAGIQALSTRNFVDDQGPLRQLEP